MNLTAILQYYSTDGVVTRARQAPELFAQLPTEISALCKIVQGLLIHMWWAQSYGVTHSQDRKAEVNLRFICKQLQKSF